MALKKIGKVLYGFIFIVLYPVILYLLSQYVAVPFTSFVPDVLTDSVSIAITILGVLLMVVAMKDIFFKAKGLPMNAYPPKKYLNTGIYKLFSHPIYFGFAFVVIGLSFLSALPTAIYLVTPLVILSILALLYGYEIIYLKKAFGTLTKPTISPLRLLHKIAKLLFIEKLYYYLVRWSEKKANSWKCYRLGKARIMNHAFYSGLGGGFLAAFITLYTGEKFLYELILLVVFGLIGAVFIGQLLVGSSDKLSRPFGYFGSVFVSILLGVTLLIINSDYIELIAVACISATFTQAIGRVRCLIQGCCHGKELDSKYSIVVTNSHSRVCAISNMSGRHIHPTPLYSILGNVVLGLILLLFYFNNANYSLIIGLYFVGAGLIRFVEEANRGEPLTKVIAKLRIYQWFSVFLYLFGIAFMFVPSQSAVCQVKNPLLALICFVVFFIICAFSMSVDFPESKLPLSKLSG